MKVLFICKASTEIGLGHLIRSRSLADTFFEKLQYQSEVKFVVIGPQLLMSRLLAQVAFETDVLESEDQLRLSTAYDFIFLDMLSIQSDSFRHIKEHGELLLSISPIFDHMHEIDVLFHRSKYIQYDQNGAPPTSFTGLEYAIIQQNCLRISTARYEENLEGYSFPIAISMGGGDAANKTLTLLRSLKSCEVPATFWVMLGEGYQHSYDLLINEIVKDSHHEIILAKTNRSMWEILKNCVLAILPGGITTYEAAYAGLPTINFTESPEKEFIIRELHEENVSLLVGDFSQENLKQLNYTIEKLYRERTELMKMHLNSKKVIDGKGAERIFNACLEMKSKLTK